MFECVRSVFHVYVTSFHVCLVYIVVSHEDFEQSIVSRDDDTNGTQLFNDIYILRISGVTSITSRSCFHPFPTPNPMRPVQYVFRTIKSTARTIIEP